MDDVLLSCGCRANSVNHKGEPSCAIHAGLVDNIVPVETPNLDGRVAKCSCGREKPSTLSLAFFEYQGPGSPNAKNRCGNCHYHEIAHKNPGSHLKGRVCDNFNPIGDQSDRYYCGCRGWD